MIPDIELQTNPYTGNIEPEIWKDVSDYEGYYQISNYGRIKSTKRTIYRKKMGPKQFCSQLIKTYISKSGYHEVMLHRDNKYKHLSIHRLVAKMFVSNHDNKPHVNHKKGIKTCNYAWELEWCTRSENQKHAVREGLIYFKGDKNNRRKLSSFQVRIIREAIAAGHKLSPIARYFKVQPGTILCIKDGRTWSSV